MVIWQSPDRFDPSRGTIRNFLCKVAHRRSIDWRRSRVGRQYDPLPDTWHPSTGATTEDMICQADAWRVVRRAVAELPQQLRTPLELAYFGRLTYRQVAAVLDLPEGTIKARIRSGLQRLGSSCEPDLASLLGRR